MIWWLYHGFFQIYCIYWCFEASEDWTTWESLRFCFPSSDWGFQRYADVLFTLRLSMWVCRAKSYRHWTKLEFSPLSWTPSVQRQVHITFFFSFLPFLLLSCQFAYQILDGAIGQCTSIQLLPIKDRREINPVSPSSICLHSLFFISLSLRKSPTLWNLNIQSILI